MILPTCFGRCGTNRAQPAVHRAQVLPDWGVRDDRYEQYGRVGAGAPKAAGTQPSRAGARARAGPGTGGHRTVHDVGGAR
ncbi:hypothetical protein GCM10018790_60010 [Kitasatospora xanthocidica]|nr:hypothetical protein GCM10018790_60010 [Kitasatospora xanthocidica]